MAHFDQPPPDQLPEIKALLSADAIRFANQLHAWIEVTDGQITAYGMSGGGTSAPPRSGCGPTG